MKKEFKAENIRFLDSVNYIDDRFISEVLAEVKLPRDADDGRPRRAWKQIAVLAACVVLLGAIFPVVSWLIGRSQIEPGGNPGAQSGDTTLADAEQLETTPPETEERFSPIPEGELDFIEHVGTVPEEFKKIVEDDLFSGADIYGDILLTYRNGDNSDLIRILDKSGNVMGEIVIDEPLSYFYRSIQCSDGNFIAFVDTRDAIDSAIRIKLVKFDMHGNVLFDNDYQYSRNVFQNIVEVDDGFICIGTRAVKTAASKRSQNDIAAIKLSADGQVENYIEFGGNDYDTIHHVEKTENGARLYFVMREQGEKRTSSWQKYDLDSDLNITKRTEITENDVPDEDDPWFTIDGKPYYRYEDFFTDYNRQKNFFYTIIEYDDFVIAVYKRFTSTMTFPEYAVSSTISPLSYYTEKVYAAYTKHGELIWRTAFDTTDYEMLKELYEK